MNEIIFIKGFSEVTLKDLASVGGKNASLGEMIHHLSKKGINVPEGFAITATAYWEFLYRNKIKEEIAGILSELDRVNFSNLSEIGGKIRTLILSKEIPEDISTEITNAYLELNEKYGMETDVAVRSSATAEDLPDASFAGQHDSYLNVTGITNLLEAVHKCFASLFNDRAIKYREDRGFDHMKVALSVGVQKMVRSDLACSGIGFTIDPESGFQNVIHLSGTWGLGENIVQGTVNPDEFVVFKTTMKEGKFPIISKKLGTKEKTMIYPHRIDHEPALSVVNTETPEEKRNKYVLSDEEIIQLAQWSLIIEEHYGKPMDIEWAKDGVGHEIFIIQARPETVQSQKDPMILQQYVLKEKGKVIVSGNSIGNKIATGKARIVHTLEEAEKLQPGEILVSETTNPDWNAVMKKAAAIVTNKGGRTSHASIVARELGIPAVVGTQEATKQIKNGQEITIDCHKGKKGFVYDSILNYDVKEINLGKIKMPSTVPMFILGDPDQAFPVSFYPNKGVGLMRLEFIITGSAGIHPMALVNYDNLKDQDAKKEIEKRTVGYKDKKMFFVEKVAQSVATIAAAFYPKDVIVRLSDFKSNEYASLLGGKEFELDEENPMIGFRGASRYYHKNYRDGFQLECEAMKMVREKMGLTNVKLMIPFCRTPEEGKKVIETMEAFGLKRGVNGLELYVMVEIPSNVLLADKFAQLFDGFSIGSNDLTQLTLGVDRDSEILSDSFSEQNEAVLKMISMAIKEAKNNKVKIGLCGQAPSDSPEFANFLVKNGIDSISFNPDAMIKGIENINKAEEKLKKSNGRSLIKNNISS